MIFGRISKNEKIVKFDLDLQCSKCRKKVPGGMKSSEKFYNSKEFEEKIKEFKQNYLCGKCRDKKRIIHD